MAYKDIKIKVTKYDWSVTAELPFEANIHSDKVPQIFRSSIDLKKYILDDRLLLRKVNEFINNRYDSPRLLPMGESMSFKVTNIGTGLSDYFMIDNNTPFIKWKVEVYNVNTKVFEGWIAPGGVSYAEGSGTGHNTHVLRIRVREKIAEFKEYFSNVRLISNDEINWTGGNEVTGRQVGLQGLLDQLFPGVRIRFSDTTTGRTVHESPRFIVYQNGVKSFWKQGYERVYTKGEDRYNFLRRLCNGLGWVIRSFVDVDNEVALRISNRSESTFPVRTMKNKNKIQFEKTKELNNNQFDAILIINGTMEGGDYPFTFRRVGAVSGEFYDYYPELKGARTILMSNKYEENYSCEHFNAVEKTSEPGTGYLVALHWNNHRFQKYAGEDNDNFRLFKFYGNEGTTEKLKYEYVSIPQDKLLRIDAGDSNPEAMKVDLNSNGGVNSGHTIGVTHFENFDMIYCGCYAEMITHNGETYEDYIKTQQFKDNFEAFLSYFEKMAVKYSTKELITEHENIITGETGNPLKVHEFDIVSMETDLFNDVTEYELISRV